MKNILKKGSKFFLSALVILNSFMNIITVHAEETGEQVHDLYQFSGKGNIRTCEIC